MAFGNRIEFVHNGTAFTQTGAINMGAQAITNCGDITADNANGFKLENSAASSSVPTIIPDRNDGTTGLSGGGTAVEIVRNGARKAVTASAGMTVAGLLNVSGNITTSGSNWALNAVTEQTTLSSGATKDSTQTIPAGSLIVGVSSRVTTTITGPASWKLGLAADDDAYGTGIALTSGTTTTIANWTATSLLYTTSAVSWRFTNDGVSNFSGGVVRVVVHYIALTAPTS